MHIRKAFFFFFTGSPLFWTFAYSKVYRDVGCCGVEGAKHGLDLGHKRVVAAPDKVQRVEVREPHQRLCVCVCASGEGFVARW